MSLHQPSSRVCQSTINHHSLEKFAITSSTVNQSNHRNQQYSVIAVTDYSGAIVERYSYTAYGEPAFFDGTGSVISNSQIANRYTYTGREYETVIRLYHYRARMYDSQLGRFLGRDLISLRYSTNYYAYVRNSALKYIDPIGHIEEEPLAGTGNIGSSQEIADGRTLETRCFMTGVQSHCRCGQPRSSTQITYSAALSYAIQHQIIPGHLGQTLQAQFGASVAHTIFCEMPGRGDRLVIHEIRACISWESQVHHHPAFEICIPGPIWGDPICFTIWDAYDSYTQHNPRIWFESILISDTGKCC